MEDRKEKLLTSNIALKLLLFGNVNKLEDLEKGENAWIRHSIYVGIGAARIASFMGLDKDYLMALGFIHDIGRKLDHSNHVILGYKILQELGFLEEAKISLTHSFIENDITLTCGMGPSDLKRKFIIENTDEATIYDNIIQICDLFCMDSGFTTIERRLLDIYTRKEITKNSSRHYRETTRLKDKFEIMLGLPFYEVFPDALGLETLEEDRKKLLELFDVENKKLKLK